MPKRLKVSDEKILEVCKNHTYLEASEILGISTSTCFNKCREAGLRKPAGKRKGLSKIKYKD